MSINLLKAAFDLEGLPPAEHLALAYLAWRYNDQTGRCDPDLAHLARIVGVKRRRLFYILDVLVVKGLLIRLSGVGRGHRNAYRFGAALTAPGQGQLWAKKVQPTAPLTAGEKVSPMTPFSAGKGVAHDREKVHSTTIKGALHDTPPKKRKKGIDPSLVGSLQERGAHKDIDPDFLIEMAGAFPTVDVPREYAKFEDWRAAKGRRFKDRRAAFRLWLRKAEEFGQERSHHAEHGAIRGERDLAQWEQYRDS